MEHCDGVGKIANLDALSQTKPGSPSYVAHCGTELGNIPDKRIHECIDQKWFPAMDCLPIQRTTHTYEHPGKKKK